jgi:hypothetical protein
MDEQIMPAPSPLLDAALSILADGKPHSAAEIYAEGVKRGLFAHETVKRIYTALTQYIQRTLGRGLKPLFTQDDERRFHLNGPADDWPQIDTTGLPPLTLPTDVPAEAERTVEAFRRTAHTFDSEGFEIAVCEAFALFGFKPRHIGGNDAPDGYADALLGELGYRVMIECKLQGANRITHSYAAVEAAKYRDAYHAGYSALVAPSFDGQLAFVSELQTHGVSAWTTDDIIRAATLRLDCYEMRDAFKAGYAASALDDIAVGRIHGPAKRLRAVASLIMDMGLAQQRMVDGLGDPATAPRITADLALFLIDDRLASTNSTHGATREEVDAAFDWLTSPYVGRAVWVDAAKSGIVLRPKWPTLL